MSSSKGFGTQKPKVRKKLCIDIANQIISPPVSAEPLTDQPFPDFVVPCYLC